MVDTILTILKILIMLSCILGCVIALFVVIIRWIRIMLQPIQRMHVKVVEKRGDRPQTFVTFEMPDGTAKELQIADPRIYQPLKENDTGMLTYKELKNSKDHHHRRFIGFIKDPNLDD